MGIITDMLCTPILLSKENFISEKTDVIMSKITPVLEKMIVALITGSVEKMEKEGKTQEEIEEIIEAKMEELNTIGDIDSLMKEFAAAIKPAPAPEVIAQPPVVENASAGASAPKSVPDAEKATKPILAEAVGIVVPPIGNGRTWQPEASA